jgi:hypothetical protein
MSANLVNKSCLDGSKSPIYSVDEGRDIQVIFSLENCVNLGCLVSGQVNHPFLFYFIFILFSRCGNCGLLIIFHSLDVGLFESQNDWKSEMCATVRKFVFNTN